MRISFRFRPIPFLATVLLVALGVALGNWQQDRAAVKTALQQQLAERGGAAALTVGAELMAAAPLEYRRVKARGQVVAGYPLYLNNRPQDGRAGFYLVMPFKLDGSDTHVLVARGWLPRNSGDAARIAPYTTPAGSVTVEGIVKASVGRVMQLGTPEPVKPGAIVQNIDPAQFAQASGLSCSRFIEQGAAALDG
jgi:cytochrome oxidase assembly protein ShyY1